jgi:hypothetical protein
MRHETFMTSWKREEKWKKETPPNIMVEICFCPTNGIYYLNAIFMYVCCINMKTVVRRLFSP